MILTIKEGSVFPIDDNLAKILKKEINKRKLRLGLLVGHFESTLNSSLRKFVKILKAGVALPKDIRFVIAESPGPISPIDDKVILHYEEKNNGEEQRQFIEGVDPNELIFEYIKPKRGKDGRDCRGNYIKVAEPLVKNGHFRADEQTINVVEDDDSIKYYSLVDGFVKNVSGLISIGKEVTISEASFKETGSIDVGENKDISVNINNEDSSNDAVGSGVNIDVKELNIKGTVGSNANVKATDLSVGEQTHRNAKLEAVENAKIHLHRGNLKAKTAEIEILENGIVQADDVYVKKMLGGEIIGHNVVVEELTSNTTVIASESIEVYAITGDHNELIIDPHKIESYHEKVEALKEQIKTKTKELKELKGKYVKELKEHNSEIDRIKKFKKRILDATKAGKTPLKADVLRIKQYKLDTQKLQDESENLKLHDEQLASLKFELDKLYEADLHGVVKCRSRYNGHTKVTFIDVKNFEEYFMLPEGIYDELFLVKEGMDKKISW